jgi:hypothetical protein
MVSAGAAVGGRFADVRGTYLERSYARRGGCAVPPVEGRVCLDEASAADALPSKGQVRAESGYGASNVAVELELVVAGIGAGEAQSLQSAAVTSVGSECARAGYRSLNNVGSFEAASMALGRLVALLADIAAANWVDR